MDDYLTIDERSVIDNRSNDEDSSTLPSPSEDTASSTTTAFFDQPDDYSNSLGAMDFSSEININIRGIGHWVNDSASGMQHWESLSSYGDFDSRMPGTNLETLTVSMFINRTKKVMEAFEISLCERESVATRLDAAEHH
jgi:hypothetical protein